MKAWSRAASALLLTVFAAVEILSPLPAFHSCTAVAGPERSAPRFADGRDRAAPRTRSCGACAVLDLSALASLSPAATVSLAPLAGAAAAPRPGILAVDHSVERGRAPPLS